MISTDEGRFHGSDGVELYWRSWMPSSANARVVVVHGMGEHCSRYDALARELTGRGLAVFAYDHRGHGRSGGQRGYVRRFDVYAADLALAHEQARSVCPGDVPEGWVAHSMGSLVALHYITTKAGDLPDCAVFSAPWLRTKTPVPPGLRRIGGVLDRIWPRAPLTNRQASPDRLTRDPGMQKAWYADLLIHSKVTPRLFKEGERAQARLLSRIKPLGLPALILVPTDDEVVDADVAVHYARSLGADATLEELEGFKHEPFNDVGREDVYARVADWLEAQLRNSAHERH